MKIFSSMPRSDKYGVSNRCTFSQFNRCARASNRAYILVTRKVPLTVRCNEQGGGNFLKRDPWVYVRHGQAEESPCPFIEKCGETGGIQNPFQY
jgi:hypothetical protein